MRHDKKFTAGHNRFVLARKIGQVVVVNDIPERLITQAIQAYLARLILHADCLFFAVIIDRDGV